VPGLAGAGTISLESVARPGTYVRHQNYRVLLHPPDGSQLFRLDASFHPVPGLADPTAVSLRSLNYPAMYLRHQNFHGYLATGGDDLFRRDATFTPTAP
jgi:hypothetical protein